MIIIFIRRRNRKSRGDAGLAVRPSTWNHFSVPIGQIKCILGIYIHIDMYIIEILSLTVATIVQKLFVECGIKG